MPTTTIAAVLAAELPTETWYTPDQAEAIAALNPHLLSAIAQAVLDPATVQAIIAPPDIATLAQVMTLAHQQGWRVLVCGQGSKLGWGHPAKAIDVVISTQRCDQILDHAVGDLTITVQAGCTLAALQERVQAVGQTIALDPSYPAQATIGGILATGDAGSWRQRYGGARDQVIGVTIVRQDGQLAKAGGKVVKNVAGYDLMKLFTSSYGSLGAIAEVTLRTYPVAESSETVVLTGAQTAIASVVNQLRASILTPTRADWCSASLIQSALASESQPAPTDQALVVQFCSQPRSVADQRDRLIALGEPASLTAQVLSDTRETELWQTLQQVMDHSVLANDTILAKIGIQPTAMVQFWDAIADTLPDGLTQVQGRLHIGSGIGLLRFPAAGITSHRLQTLRSVCTAQQGYLVVLEAPIALKQQIDVWGYSGNALGLMQRLKTQFDPQNRLSPGRFVGGL